MIRIAGDLCWIIGCLLWLRDDAWTRGHLRFSVFLLGVDVSRRFEGAEQMTRNQWIAFRLQRFANDNAELILCALVAVAVTAVLL
jgi:hypothetical protein